VEQCYQRGDGHKWPVLRDFGCGRFAALLSAAQAELKGTAEWEEMGKGFSNAAGSWSFIRIGLIGRFNEPLFFFKVEKRE
jgi:hypothetical protein